MTETTTYPPPVPGTDRPVMRVAETDLHAGDLILWGLDGSDPAHSCARWPGKVYACGHDWYGRFLVLDGMRWTPSPDRLAIIECPRPDLHEHQPDSSPPPWLEEE